MLLSGRRIGADSYALVVNSVVLNVNIIINRLRQGRIAGFHGKNAGLDGMATVLEVASRTQGEIAKKSPPSLLGCPVTLHVGVVFIWNRREKHLSRRYE